MSASHDGTAVQRMFAIALSIGVAAWLISVPTTIIGTSTVLAAVVLFMALGWVAFTTHGSAMPAPHPGRRRRDADVGSSDRQRRPRGRS